MCLSSSAVGRLLPSKYIVSLDSQNVKIKCIFFYLPLQSHFLHDFHKLCMNLYSIMIFSSSCHRNFPFAHEWERRSLRTHAVCNDKCIYFFFCKYPSDCDFGHTQKCFTIAGSECQKRILSIQSTISHHNTSYKC